MSDSDMLDDILDGTLDDIADLPSFEPFTHGVHKCLASMSVEKMGDKAGIKLDLTLVETLELAADVELAEGEEPSKPGDTCGTAFFMDNKYGAGNFKRLSKPFADQFGWTSRREVVEGVQELEVVVITTTRGSKDDANKRYLEIVELALV